MNNYILKLVFQMPLIWILISTIQYTFETSAIYSSLITFLLVIFYDIGEYIGQGDSK